MPSMSNFQPTLQSNVSTNSTFLSTVSLNYQSALSVWHRRLGHPNVNIVKRICRIIQPHLSINNTVPFCDACAVGKTHALPFPSSTTQYTAPLQLIVSELWGPAYKMSKNGFRYYTSFMDVYSRYTWIYFLQTKSEALSKFIQFKTLIENC